MYYGERKMNKKQLKESEYSEDRKKAMKETEFIKAVKKEEKEEKAEKKEKKVTQIVNGKLEFHSNIKCVACGTIKGVRKEVFDKRVEKYGSAEALLKEYKCVKCRK